jgi:hypothetical protein
VVINARIPVPLLEAGDEVLVPTTEGVKWVTLTGPPHPLTTVAILRHEDRFRAVAPLAHAIFTRRPLQWIIDDLHRLAGRP